MLATLIACALAGDAFVNTEVPPADGEMEISNLRVATRVAGTCGAEVPTADAQLELTLTAVNRDDTDYRIEVRLEDLDAEFSLHSLMTDTVLGAPLFPGWTQGWQVGSTHLWYGRWTLLGEIESGPANQHTVNWRFHVRLIRNEDDAVLQHLKVDWSKTYGTCS
jgi:hypothetical protein